MRKVDRISRILKELEYIWRECPDLRLGQMIMNLESVMDVYYADDDELINVLKCYYFKND